MCQGRRRHLQSALANVSTPLPALCVTPCWKRCNAPVATCVAVWRRAEAVVVRRPTGTPPFLVLASPCLQGHPGLHHGRKNQRRKRQPLKILRRRQQRRRRGGRRKTEQQQQQLLQQRPKKRQQPKRLRTRRRIP